jgi:hypothetical protein
VQEPLPLSTFFTNEMEGTAVIKPLNLTKKDIRDLKSGYASDGVQAASHDNPILDTRVDKVMLQHPATATATSDDDTVPPP